jgi:hypothetical protein
MLVAPSVVLNWGFADRWEVVLGGRNVIALGSEVQEPRARVEDVSLSLKGVLREGSLQEKYGWSVATELSLLIPTVDDDHAGAEGAIVASRRWPELTVHVNGAALWTRAHQPAAFGGVIIEGHDAWAVRPVAEVFVEGERDSATTISGLLGTIWRVSDRLSLDAAIRLARAGGVSTTELRVGLTWGFRLR